jgi:peroxiredoxin
MKKNILLFGLLLFAQLSFAQGYKISVKINNLKDTTVFLAHHFADKIYVDDTLKLNSKGEGSFKGKNKKTLPGGIYVVFLPNKTYFDILVTEKEQVFSLVSDTANFSKTLKFTNTLENKLFYEYQNFIEKKRKEIDPLVKEREKVKNDPKKTKEFQDKIEAIDKSVSAEMQRIITENPNLFLSKFLTATKEVKVPPTPLDANGKPIDPDFQYNYYKAHFWDNIDFSDDRILRTPIVEPKLMQYITKVIFQMPDTLKKECDMLIKKSKGNKEWFRYMLGTLYNYYNKSQIMGMDAVFVHLADYYLRGEADWNDSAYINKLKKRVDEMRYNLIGLKAVDFTVPDINMQNFTLSEVKEKFTILVFFDTECSHCQHEMPIFVRMNNRLKEAGMSAKLVTFYTQGNQEKFMKFVKDYKMDWTNIWDPYQKSNYRFFYNIFSTPALFLLDKDKKIIAKRIDPLQTENIIWAETINEAVKNLEGSAKITQFKYFLGLAKTQTNLKIIKDAILLFRLSEAEKKDIEDFVTAQNAKLPLGEPEPEPKK